MFLLGLIELNMGGGGMGEGLQKRVDAMGIWGALLLGIVFALTFCPTSAALFFGSLVPLSLKVNSSVTLPIVYGVGTALPVMMFAVLLATSAQSVGKAYNVTGQDRVVGSDGYGLDLRARRHLLLAEVRLSGAVSCSAVDERESGAEEMDRICRREAFASLGAVLGTAVISGCRADALRGNAFAAAAG